MSAQVTTLSGSLEIRDVEELRARLLGVLTAATSLQVDLSGVSVADTAGVQLLLSLRAEGVKRAVPIEFFGISPVLDRALRVLGMSDSLADEPHRAG